MSETETPQTETIEPQATPPAETQPEAGAAEATVQTKPQPQPLPEGQHWFWGTGRRKTSVARVRIRPGSGRFLINGKAIDRYFTQPRDRNDMLAPLQAIGVEGQLDVYVRVRGGGPSGQAGATRLGLSRALREYDPSTEHALRDKGYMTTDDRQVERKKYGQPGARARFQFSKR